MELHKIVDRENYIFDHDLFSKKEFGNGIYVTKFTREKLPCDSTLRRYYCNYEDKIGKSEYHFLALMNSMQNYAFAYGS